MGFLEDEPSEDGMFHTKMQLIDFQPQESLTKWTAVSMNTEQVVEMIDAITEGKNFLTKWEGGEGELTFASDAVEFSIVIRDALVVRDPRIAREIAGALVAWANRKEGSETRYVLNPELNLTTDEIQLEFEALHRILAKTPDIPKNKNKLIELQRRIQILRENGAKDFDPDV